MKSRWARRLAREASREVVEVARSPRRGGREGGGREERPKSPQSSSPWAEIRKCLINK